MFSDFDDYWPVFNNHYEFKIYKTQHYFNEINDIKNKLKQFNNVTNIRIEQLFYPFSFDREIIVNIRIDFIDNLTTELANTILMLLTDNVIHVNYVSNEYSTNDIDEIRNILKFYA
jgi:hypothetical protein